MVIFKLIGYECVRLLKLEYFEVVYCILEWTERSVSVCEIPVELFNEFHFLLIFCLTYVSNNYPIMLALQFVSFWIK